jgi:hypothetical protein
MSHIRPVTDMAEPSVINMRSTLRTAPDLCQHISFAVLFGSSGSSYTVSAQPDVYIYTHILHNVEILVGQEK